MMEHRVLRPTHCGRRLTALLAAPPCSQLRVDYTPDQLVRNSTGNTLWPSEATWPVKIFNLFLGSPLTTTCCATEAAANRSWKVYGKPWSTHSTPLTFILAFSNCDKKTVQDPIGIHGVDCVPLSAGGQVETGGSQRIAGGNRGRIRPGC